MASTIDCLCRIGHLADELVPKGVLQYFLLLFVGITAHAQLVNAMLRQALNSKYQLTGNLVLL